MSDAPAETTGTPETVTDATTAEVSGEAAHNQTPILDDSTDATTDGPGPVVEDGAPAETSTEAPAEAETAQVQESYSGNIDLTGAGNEPEAQEATPASATPTEQFGQAQAENAEDVEAAKTLASETAKSDNDWRTENPNEAYVREPVEGLGGESFTYGGKAE